MAQLQFQHSDDVGWFEVSEQLSVQDSAFENTQPKIEEFLYTMMCLLKEVDSKDFCCLW